MAARATLEVSLGDAALRLEGVAADFHDPAGAEVLVFYDPPDAAHVHVYRREIADGALSCALGGRVAAVSMDLGFLMRIVTEALRAGLTAEGGEIEALRAALAAAGQGKET